MKLPYLKRDLKTLKDVTDVIDDIVEKRSKDLKDFDNLNNVFISGRRVGKIPSAATDVDPDFDKVNDVNIADDAGTVYLYTLVNVSGTAVWGRVALDTTW